MNLPNKLSITRMALIPVMVALMHPDTPVCRVLSALVFAAAAFTDFLDGHIARKHHIVTDFGKFVVISFFRQIRHIRYRRNLLSVYFKHKTSVFFDYFFHFLSPVISAARNRSRRSVSISLC